LTQAMQSPNEGVLLDALLLKDKVQVGFYTAAQY